MTKNKHIYNYSDFLIEQDMMGGAPAAPAPKKILYHFLFMTGPEDAGNNRRKYPDGSAIIEYPCYSIEDSILKSWIKENIIDSEKDKLHKSELEIRHKNLEDIVKGDRTNIAPDDLPFIEKLKEHHGDFYLVPEGGTNSLAVKGCEEILISEDVDFTHICCAIGTGGTISGLINSAKANQKIIGFPALKGDFLSDDIRKFVTNSNWELQLDYHFGGYAKINAALIRFINDFYKQTNIPLDPIYTGKMMFGIVDLINKGYFPKGAKILAIHTGGLQGIEGMNRNLKNKNLPLIAI